MMLIVERTSNGQSIVVIKKDWHPNRIGKAYQRPMQNNMQSRDAWNLQTAYLNNQPRKQS
jgi:hypothetical protein